jgi:hypothetical protein
VRWRLPLRSRSQPPTLTLATARPAELPSAGTQDLVQSNWSLSYSVSNDDGLIVTGAQYKGSSVFYTVDLVKWAGGLK